MGEMADLAVDQALSFGDEYDDYGQDDPGLWFTSKGECYYPSSMDAQHLRNAINLMKKQGFISVADFAKNPEQEAKPNHMIDLFKYELKKRGLKLNLKVRIKSCK